MRIAGVMFACALLPALMLTGCSNPNAKQLDQLLSKINYKSVGPVTSFEARNDLDSSARSVTYGSRQAYDALLRRFSRAGYRCDQLHPVAGEDLATCHDSSRVVSVGFKREPRLRETVFSISIP